MAFLVVKPIFSRLDFPLEPKFDFDSFIIGFVVALLLIFSTVKAPYILFFLLLINLSIRNKPEEYKKY